jgi:ectoine hydroxylase-related dioxygenase (phytanoyl-CoA dioxygenase family)
VKRLSHLNAFFLVVVGVRQFVLGSHRFPEPPSAEMNAVPTVAGVGVHEHVVQVPCPAGSAVIYDSRTYHRPCPELNVSGEERLAILNCTTPSFVRDLSARNDKKKSAEDFVRQHRPLGL